MVRMWLCIRTNSPDMSSAKMHENISYYVGLSLQTPFWDLEKFQPLSVPLYEHVQTLCFQLHYVCGNIQWSKTNDNRYIPSPACPQQQGFRCSFWHNSTQHHTLSTGTAADLTRNDRIQSAQLAQCACAGLNRQWAMASGCRRKRILKR